MGLGNVSEITVRPAASETASAVSANFDPHWYLATYPDVAAAGLDPWFHYDRYGRAEGRLGRAPAGTAAERDLWSGFAEAGLATLEAQRQSPDPVARGTACWALARWHFAQKNLDRAAELCRDMLPGDQPAPAHFGIGMLVLAGHVALSVNDSDRARSVLRLARETMLSESECDLLEANVSGQALAALNRIWARARLGRMRLTRGPEAAFDRLARPIVRPPILPRRGPLVSVIVPAFNAQATLPTALNSLAGQRWKALEVIIIDDGSTDDTGTIARRFARADPRFRVISSSGNEGAYPARNLGAMAARGAYITVLDADDWAHPSRISKQVRSLIAEPDLMGNVTHWVRATPDLHFTDWRIEPEGLIHRNVSSLMIRRAVLDQLGCWDRVRIGADTEYYYRLIAAYGSAAIGEVMPGVPLSLGQIVEDSLTSHTDTHISSQFGGLRAAYHEASLRWHVRAQKAAAADRGKHPLHLPEYPAHRPFAVPDGVDLGDPQAPLEPDDIIRRSPLFDAEWYLNANPDVRHATWDPALNYLNGGAAQGRDPSPRLSSSGYRQAYLQGVREDRNANPVLHWHAVGHARGFSPLPRIDGPLADKTPTCLFFGHQAKAELFGAERCLPDALDRLVAQGEVPVVVLPQILNREYLETLKARSAGIQIIPYPWRQAGHRHRAETLEAIDALLEELKPREVHINTIVVDVPIEAAQAHNAPVVYHVHERPDQDAALCDVLGADASTIRDWLSREAARFVANSAGVSDWLAAPERTEIVPNRVDPALFELPLANRTLPAVAMISSNIAKKGIADFLEMAQQLAHHGLTNPCLLIGPETDDLAALRPLPATVQTLGYVEGPATALAHAEIVVNLSKFAESFGLTVLEAMAAGRAVVCYARGHLPELVEDGRSGFLVPPDDPAAAARAVIRLLEDPALRRDIGQGASQRARALLSTRR